MANRQAIAQVWDRWKHRELTVAQAMIFGIALIVVFLGVPYLLFGDTGIFVVCGASMLWTAWQDARRPRQCSRCQHNLEVPHG